MRSLVSPSKCYPGVCHGWAASEGPPCNNYYYKRGVRPHGLARRLVAVGVMAAHASAPPPCPAPAPPPAARNRRLSRPPPAVAAAGGPGRRPAQEHATAVTLHPRRTLIYSLVGSGLGFATHGGGANAASRRPPPPPPTEKKDPNVSGVQAKVLASIKRKEAMKEAMAKERERGKPINEPPQ